MKLRKMSSGNVSSSSASSAAGRLNGDHRQDSPPQSSYNLIAARERDSAGQSDPDQQQQQQHPLLPSPSPRVDGRSSHRVGGGRGGLGSRNSPRRGDAEISREDYNNTGRKSGGRTGRSASSIIREQTEDNMRLSSASSKRNSNGNEALLNHSSGNNNSIYNNNHHQHYSQGMVRDGSSGRLNGRESNDFADELSEQDSPWDSIGNSYGAGVGSRGSRLGMGSAGRAGLGIMEAGEDSDDELLFVDEERKLYNTSRSVRNAYEDFSTIDWVRDNNKEKKRQKKLKRWRQSISKTRRWYWEAHDSCQGWIVVFLVGLSTGFCAAFVDIGTDWLSDIKVGICKSSFWLNKEFCCWASEESGVSDSCDDFQPWSRSVFDRSDPSSWLSNVIDSLFYVGSATIFGVLSAVLVQQFAPYASGSGIPEVKTILSGFVIRKYLGLWTLLIKCIGLVLSVASGLSLGKEGPLVHVACCCGNIFSRFFVKYRQNEAKKREVLSAAAAAGVSVAFGAPIGGVLFSLEEVSYYFPHKTMWRTFFCALTAAGTLQYLNPFRTGRLVMFYVTYNRPWHVFEVIPFILIGVMGGLYGAIFNKANITWCSFKKRSKIFERFQILEVLFVTLFTAVLNNSIDFLRISRSSLIKELFAECVSGSPSLLCADQYSASTYWSLTGCLVISLLLTIFTFGVKVPAGLFIPTMAFGAIYGRMIGVLMEYIVHGLGWEYFKENCEEVDKCVTPGLYAMVGAAAALGGVTRMTVSLVVIMFELTGGLTYIIPIMLAVMTSKWVGDAFEKEGIYDMHIRLSGYPFLENKESYNHEYLAKEVMYPRDSQSPLRVISVGPNRANSLSSMEQLLEDTDYRGFPVVSSGTKLTVVGYVTRSELKECLDLVASDPDVVGTSPCIFTGSPPTGPFVDCRPALDTSPIVVSDTARMDLVFDMFCKMGVRTVLVTHMGYLVGIITKKDLVRHVASVNNHDPNEVRFH
eukprot:Nk52_evm9s328 gene=Nk52_evmTU9s328